MQRLHNIKYGGVHCKKRLEVEATALLLNWDEKVKVQLFWIYRPYSCHYHYGSL